MLPSLPHLTAAEFNEACEQLQAAFKSKGHKQEIWTSVDTIHQDDTQYLRITKALKTEPATPNIDDDDDEIDQLEEADNEALPPSPPQPIISYDIILSPTYLVPTLYIHITDPLHRYPPTIPTLHAHLIPPAYRSQTDSVGVMGGVSITDHPVTGRPVFFIHPCQTAGVMQEVLKGAMGKGNVTPQEYVLLWIGALGGCVGLNVPLELVRAK